MVNKRTARQRFVEAMREMNRHISTRLPRKQQTEPYNTMRQAVEAFADATYVRRVVVRSGALYEDKDGEIQHETHDELVGDIPEQYRAALLKEVFGE